jgi:gliding motility-associated-like protein
LKAFRLFSWPASLFFCLFVAFWGQWSPLFADDIPPHAAHTANAQLVIAPVCVGNPSVIQILNDIGAPDAILQIDVFNDAVIDFEFRRDNPPAGNLRYNFTAPGRYPVRLTIRDSVNGTPTYETTGFAEVLSRPEITFITPNFTICSNDVAQLLVIVDASTTTNPQFSWSPRGFLDNSNIANPKASRLPAGITKFFVQVADPNLHTCSYNDSVSINVQAPPTVNAGADQTICNFPSPFNLSATAQGGTFFRWQPASSVSNPLIPNPQTRIDSTTTFTVTVSSDAQFTCTGRDTVRVSVLNAMAGEDQTICDTKNAELTAKGTLPGCRIQWTLENGNPIPPAHIRSGSPNGPTIEVQPFRDACYRLSITNCPSCNPNNSTEDVVCVKYKTSNSTAAGRDTFVCRGDSVQMQATPGARRYEWSPKSSLSDPFIANPKASPRITTNYTVQITDTSGCVTFPIVTVFYRHLPFYAGLAKDSIVCRGDRVTLSRGGTGPTIQYTWQPTTFFVAGNANSTNPTVLPQGNITYTYTINDRSNNCQYTDTFRLNLRERPVDGRVNGDTLLCLGEATTLVGTGNLRYEWFNVPEPGFYDSLEVQPSRTTTYRVLPYNAQCPARDTLAIRVQVEPVPSGRIISPTQGCWNRNVTIRLNYQNPRSEDQVIWDWQGANVNLAPGGNLQSGPFLVQWNTIRTARIQALLITAVGCSTQFEHTIRVFPTPIVDAGAERVVCLGEVVQLAGAITNTSEGTCSYQWLPADGLSNANSLNPFTTIRNSITYRLVATCNGCVSDTDSVRLQIVPRPLLIVDTGRVAICRGQSARLGTTVIPPAALDPYRYEWLPALGLSNNRIPNPIANPSETTTYTLITYDINGCASNRATVEVIVNELPKVEAGSDVKLCAGQEQGVWLEGRPLNLPPNFGSFRYEWIPKTGLTFPDQLRTFARPTQTTVYQLIAIDNRTGCRSDSSAIDTASRLTVEFIPVPRANVGDSVVRVCEGESIVIGGAPIGIGDNYRYRWTPVQGLRTPDSVTTIVIPKQTTTYWLSIEHEGCISTVDTVLVWVVPRPSVKTRNKENICPGDSIQLKVEYDAAWGPYTFNWIPPINISDTSALEPIVWPDTTTVYEVQITGALCRDLTFDTVEVRVFKAVVIDANPDDLTLRHCLSDSTAGFVLPAVISFPDSDQIERPYFVRWEPKESLTDSNSLNPIARPKETTIYTVTVTHRNCINQDTLRLNVIPTPDIRLSSDTNDVCGGDLVTISATGVSEITQYRWEWDDSLGVRQIQPDTLSLTFPIYQTRTFFYIAEEAICADTYAITIRVIPRALIDFDFELIPGCAPWQVSFRDLSRPAQFWRWDFGDGTDFTNEQHPYHTYQAAGTYDIELTVWSAGGCQDTLKVEKALRILPQLEISATSNPAPGSTLRFPDPKVQFNAEANFPPVRWFWRFGDGQYADVQNPQHTFAFPGSYYVEVIATDSVDCQDTVRLGPYSILEPTLDIPNYFTPNGDGQNDVWFIDYQGQEPYRLRVYDRIGRLMFETENPLERWNGTLDNSGGKAMETTYFYLLNIGDKKYTGNVTILR